MNIYFSASIAGKIHYQKNYQTIIDILHKRGCSVIYKHIMDGEEAKIRLESKQDRLTFHKTLTNWISGADCMVAETSFPSISVGYEISLALTYGKPVLILYSDGYPPSLLAAHQSEKLVCEKYTLRSVDSLLEDFLNFVKGSHDTRFTFFITHTMNTYLDTISRGKKMPKSVYLRSLIEKDMKKTV